MKEQIDISVVIPCYNRRSHIQRAMLSVLGQQEFKVRELFVLDDFSSDDSVDQAEALRPLFLESGINLIIYTSYKNYGPSVQRNRGINASKGKYIAFLDSDDYWDSKKLIEFNKDLKTQKAISFWACKHTHSLDFMNDNGEMRRINFWQQIIKNHASCSSIIVERVLCPFFREDMKYCEDYELFTRLSFKVPLHLNPKTLTYIDRPVNSGGGLSSDCWNMRLGELRMYVYAASYSPAVGALLPFLIIYSLLKQLRLVMRG